MTNRTDIPRINIPSTLIIAGGASRQAGIEAKRLGIRRAVVVTDPYLKKIGLADQVQQDLSDEDVESTLFAEVDPDPSVANMQAGLAMLQDSGADGILAIGGGSSIDCAKAMSIMSRNEGTIADYMGYHKIPKAGVPLIAIPTTAGTGSEVTKVTVITDTDRNVKMMLLDAHLLPTAALVDYELTMTMPPPLTAAVGVDSLTHAIEAYVSKKAQPFTDFVALESARLIATNLRTAYQQPDNASAREAMMQGSTLGGIAFSNASVALVHGMSRPIGAHFHVPHGLSNAMLLPTVTRFSVETAPTRYAHLARHIGLADATDDTVACGELVEALQRLNVDLQVQTPQDYGIDRAAYEKLVPEMATSALASGSPGFNPRIATAQEIEELYHQFYA